MLFVLISILLSLSVVQTKLGRIATNYLNEDFNTHITVDKVHLSLFGNVDLKGVDIRDHHLDSMIFVEKLTTSIYSYQNILDNKFEFSEINIEGLTFMIKTYKGEKDDAFVQFVDSFDDEVKDTIPSGFLMTAELVVLKNANIKSINYNDLNATAVTFKNVSGSVEDLIIDGPNFSGAIKGIKFVENHHIEVENFTSDFTYTRKEMKLLNTTLETKTSKVLTDITFFRNGSFADFNNKVKFEAVIKNASVSLTDLQKFYSDFGEKDVLHFKTKLNGTLNNFKAKDFQLTSDKKAIVSGDFHVKNSFNSKNEFSLNAHFTEFVSDYHNIEILLPKLFSEPTPSILKELGRVSLSGNTLITKNKIEANIQMNTALGSVITDLKLTNLNNVDETSYKGHVKFIDLELGKIMNDSLAGKLSMDADVDGRGFSIENINTIVVGEIHKHQYKGYTYNNIDVNGRFQNKKFEGELIIDDENLNLNFNGLADLSKAVYKFDFETVVAYANFNKLNLFTRDSIAILKGEIDIDLEGNSIENMIGTINFEKASYTNQNDNYYFEDFNITSSFKDTIRTVTLNSTDIINGEVVGDFKFVQLPKLAKNALGSIYANYEPYEVEKGQFLDFKFNIYNKIVDVFFPKVKLASNTFITGSINSDNQKIELTVKSPQIIAYDNIINDVRLQIDTDNPLFNTQLTIDNITTKSYDISKLNLVNITLNDTLFFRTAFIGGQNKKDNYSLGFYHTIDENNNSVIGINKSEIKYKDTKWLVNPSENKLNKIVFDNKFTHFDIQEFEMISGNQKITFSGSTIGANQKDINLKLENVILEGITPEIDNWNFTGLINGTLAYSENADGVLPVANIQIEDFSVNESPQGNLKIGMIGRNSSQTYNVNISLENEELNTLFANGVVDFAPEQATVDVGFEFEKFKLNILSPIGGENFTNIRGEIYGNARLEGILKNPDMTGEFYIFDSGIKIPYLNVDYDFEGTTIVELKNQTFKIIDLTLKDVVEETRGTLLGTISHNYFTDWKLNLKLETNNLLILNTTEEEESLYFGSGFIDGQATIKGYTDNLTIDVVGKTKKGTHFVIPMSSTKSVGNSSLVRFVTHQEKELKTQFPDEVLFNRLKGLSLNFNLEITKDAIIEMVLDQTTGSMLKGSGTGNLLIELDTNGKFNMYGDFVIDNGDYIFSYKEVINKKFIATRGGTVSWNGNPYDAEIDIETKIRVYANPKYLLENVYTNRDIAVDLVARFSGGLFDSNQEYDILIPDADSELKSELDFKLNGTNDTNTKMNNFGSLLLFGSFTSEESNLGDNSRMMFAGISEDILSKALTSMINSGDGNLKVGVTYDIGDTSSSLQNLQTEDQLGITVATQFNDRILIDGKIGVPVGSSDNQSGLVGEVEIEFLLNPEGTLRSSVFNRQNEIQYSEEEEGYTQGVGLKYQFDFDTGSEFLEKIGLKKRKVAKDSIKKQKDSIALKKSVVGFK